MLRINILSTCTSTEVVLTSHSPHVARLTLPPVCLPSLHLTWHYPVHLIDPFYLPGWKCLCWDCILRLQLHQNKMYLFKYVRARVREWATGYNKFCLYICHCQKNLQKKSMQRPNCFGMARCQYPKSSDLSEIKAQVLMSLRMSKAIGVNKFYEFCTGYSILPLSVENCFVINGLSIMYGFLSFPNEFSLVCMLSQWICQLEWYRGTLLGPVPCA